MKHTPKVDTPRQIVRRRDLYEAVIMDTGVRNGEVRAVMDALFENMHRALSQDADLHVPPLGQIKCITRKTDTGSRKIYKLHLTKFEKP